jgi:hypothetical protein
MHRDIPTGELLEFGDSVVAPTALFDPEPPPQDESTRTALMAAATTGARII